MPSTTYTFNTNKFTAATPDWAVEGDYSKGLRFQTVTKTLQLDNENYGRGDFTLTFSGDFDYGSIHFSTPNGSTVSVSTDINGAYLIHNDRESGAPAETIFKNESITTSPKTFYVVVNGDPDSTTSLLNVSIALAKSNSIPSANPSISLSYNCPNSNLYEYEVGLHTWSPYDARDGSSTLRTKLYSPTQVSSWGTNTYVYSSPYLTNPALPYFYGYGSKVYRVGEEWSRSYGLKFKYEVRITTHWFFKKKSRTSRKTIGPLETLNLGTDNNEPTSEACIEPVMRNIGKIRAEFNNSSLSQPQQYRYYMGYNSTSKTLANSGPFTEYDIAKKKHYPITGLLHVLKKHTRGIVNGYNKTYSGDVNWLALITGTGIGLLSALAGESIISGIARFFSSIPGPLPSFEVIFGAQAAATLGTILIVLAILYIIWKLILAFRPKTYTYQENCRNFLHHFANTPYLNNGTSLYRDDDLEHDNAGWYSDGVYYYQQTGTEGSRTITTKQLSFINSFAGYSDNNTPQFEFLYSLPADDPTLVTEWQKLILLPYCSGKPIPYCGGSTIYYSQAFSHNIDTQCCELENCNDSIVISIPSGTITSCISQDDADNKAEEIFSASIDWAEDYGVYTETLDDSLIGQLEVNFTHEIKEEDNPTSMAFFWDLRSGSDAPAGTPVYYDHTGCQKLLPGYYATSGSNYPKYYYKVEGGEVAAIYTQSSAAATTVTPGGGTIVKTDEGRSSNWYLKSTTKPALSAYIYNTNDRTFDVTSLISTSPLTLNAGRITSGSYISGSFLKYGAFNSTGVTDTNTTENGTGWYAPLNGWKPDEDDFFFYQNSLGTFNGGDVLPTTSTPTAICGDTIDTTYYYDGVGLVPAIGDKVYNTQNIEDPTSDGYIKYGSSQYLLLNNGVVINTISCNPDTEFSGSATFSTSSLNTMCSKDITTFYDHDNTGDSGRWPAVGDVISDSDRNQVSNVMIKYLETDDRNEYPESQVLHIGSTGTVLQIIDCDRVGAGTSPLRVRIDTSDGPAGFDSSENPTSNSGIGGGNDGFGHLQYQFDTSYGFGRRGWKIVGLLWKRTTPSDAEIQLTIRYPEQNDISNTPTSWDSLEITQPGNTTFSFNRTDATLSTFSDSSGNEFYRYTWDQLTNPFDTDNEVVNVLLDVEAV